MKKLFAIVMMLMLIPVLAQAEKVLKPVYKTTVTPVGGADTSAEAQILRVDADGSIYVNMTGYVEGTIFNGSATITQVGATDRLQLPSQDASICLIQAPTTNAGIVYVGGSTVTNASGSNEGVALYPTWSMSEIKVNNLSDIYVAADSASDKVKYFCR